MKKILIPKRLKRTAIYKSPWINLYTDRVLLPSGKIIEKYHFLDYPKKSVVILLQNNKKEILFIKSLRYTTQKIEWELPAGQIEKREKILDAAKREVEEETGFKVKNLKHIYTFLSSVCMSNHTVYIIFGKIKTQSQKDFDKDEIKETYWLSKTRIEKLIRQKKITCGVSLIPILLNDYLKK